MTKITCVNDVACIDVTMSVKSIANQLGIGVKYLVSKHLQGNPVPKDENFSHDAVYRYFWKNGNCYMYIEKLPPA